MSEELGKIEKPSAEEFRGERKLFFVPLLYRGEESPSGYVEKLNIYWKQVEEQLNDLEVKLGKISKILHELIPAGGEEGSASIKDLNEKSYNIVKTCTEKGAQLEALEDIDLLTELMDWSKCLAVGLQNEMVLKKVYEFYIEANKKRNEHLASRIDETLKADEVGILLMREGHQVQFPQNMQVFYVAPPSLNEIKRWLRDRESRLEESQQQEESLDKNIPDK